MAYNRRSGGYGGYGSGGGAGGGGGGGGSGGGRYNSGGYRSGAAGTVNPWQSNSGAGGPMSRQSQQGGHHPPAQLALASNIISKLLTSSNSMPGNGYGGGPSRSANWGNGGPRMAHIGIRQRQDGAGGFNKDNRRRGDPHNRFSGGGRKSGGGAKDGEKRKSAGKVNDENKKGQNERERTKEQLDADKKASYVGVPSAVLYCHVCSKHMWDSESFEKHVRGRPHELMMTYLDEAYRMRVDYMRHQIKAVENQREIDLERVTNNKHKSNSGNKTSGGNSNASKPLLRSYCPMCDVRFYGPLTGHRKSDRHRKLKQFLHPECKLCDALFHTRLEMDEHKLTAGHLKKVAEIRNQEYPFLKDDEFDLIDMIKIEEEEQQDHDQIPVAKKYEMLGDRDATKLKLELEGGSGEKRRNEKKDSSNTESNVTATATPDDKKVENGLEDEQNEVKDEEVNGLKEEQETDIKKEEEMETSIVASITEDSIVEDTATELTKEENTTNTESATNKDNTTAAYDPNVAIGKELLVPSKGYVCRLCNCFLLDEERVSIHCQTAAHYINYTTMTKMKEATSSGKKRGIDQVIEEDPKQVDAESVNGDGIENENVASQEPNVTESEGPAVKRIKLDDAEENKLDTEENNKLVTEDNNKLDAEDNKMDTDENDKIDTSEQQPVTEVKPSVIENATNVEESTIQEKTVEIAEQPTLAPEVAAPVVAPVVTPTRGRGGRGRGGRGGVARRARR